MKQKGSTKAGSSSIKENMARITRSVRCFLDKNYAENKENKNMPAKRTLRPRQLATRANICPLHENKNVQKEKSKSTVLQPKINRESIQKPSVPCGRALAAKQQCVLKEKNSVDQKKSGEQAKKEAKSSRKRPAASRQSSLEQTTTEKENVYVKRSKTQSLLIQAKRLQKNAAKKVCLGNNETNENIINTTNSENCLKDTDIYDFDFYHKDEYVSKKHKGKPKKGVRRPADKKKTIRNKSKVSQIQNKSSEPVNAVQIQPRNKPKSPVVARESEKKVVSETPKTIPAIAMACSTPCSVPNNNSAPEEIHGGIDITFGNTNQFVTSTPEKKSPSQITVYYSTSESLDDHSSLKTARNDNDCYALFVDTPEPRRRLLDDDDDIIMIEKPKHDYSQVKVTRKKTQKPKAAAPKRDKEQEEKFNDWASQMANHFSEIDNLDLLVE